MKKRAFQAKHPERKTAWRMKNMRLLHFALFLLASALAAIAKSLLPIAFCASLSALFFPRRAAAAEGDLGSLEERMAPLLLSCPDVEGLAEGLGASVTDVKAALESLSLKITSLTRQANQSAIGHIARAYSLTERETMVLEALSSGKQNGEIASALFISESTVKFHVGNMLRKFSLKNRRQVSDLVEAYSFSRQHE
jgi:DNA-binding CsgD family transcriptional regulator